MGVADRQARYADQFRPLIGPDAVASLVVTLRWSLWFYLVGYSGVILAFVTATAPASVRWVTLFPVVVIVMLLAVQRIRLARRTGKLASEYLTPRVGFPVHLTTTYRTLESWNRAIERQRQRYQAGSKA